MLTRARTLPLIGEELPCVLALPGLHRRSLPLTVVDFDLDGPNRRAVIQHEAEDLDRVSTTGYARDDRFDTLCVIVFSVHFISPPTI